MDATHTIRDSVLHVGQLRQFAAATPGLRLMLKMMRRPANLAGLGALQQFLEAGFDTFAAMGRQGEGAQHFLEIVQSRETRLIDLLFDGSTVACETELTQLLDKPGDSGRSSCFKMKATGDPHE